MLASITPLGGRGGRSRWAVIVISFATGATAAGAAAGALLGSAGSVALGSGVGPRPRLLALAAGALVALSLDLRAAAVPGPRRQVDERWRDEYRGWVYGAGYGAQLGVGVSTVVRSATTYLTLVAAFLSGGPGPGAVIVGIFGAARGLQPLATVHVRRPGQLLALHVRLRRWRGAAARSCCLVSGVVLVAALAGSTQ